MFHEDWEWQRPLSELVDDKYWVWLHDRNEALAEVNAFRSRFKDPTEIVEAAAALGSHYYKRSPEAFVAALDRFQTKMIEEIETGETHYIRLDELDDGDE
jgi:hypothetical protein